MPIKLENFGIAGVAGIVPHGRNLAELGHLVNLGMSPLRAIHTGTMVSARTMGLDEHTAR
jgi:imidazolonepropionase-like amidohydrolase